MLYRRKILLSLIETFGGVIKLQECYRLTYLFCLKSGKNYYDFFPYVHGYFSFLLEHDQEYLSTSGLLGKKGDEIYLADKDTSLQEQLSNEDRKIIRALFDEANNIDLNNIIDHKYDINDQYTSRKQSLPGLFTLGYEGLSIDAFLNMLLQQRITALVDVRNNPVSMKYGFSKRRLAECVGKVGIVYIHLPELGVPSSLRKGLDDERAYENLFAYYTKSILPQQETSLGYVKELIDQYGRVALTCFESNPHFCHRHKITEYLEHNTRFDIPIIHLQRGCTIHTRIGYTSSNRYIFCATSSS
jgi:hypothetical protein